MKVRKLEALFLSLMVGAVISTPRVANATNGAQFTSLEAVCIGLNDNGICETDDLEVTFTETGIGNGQVSDITVTAVREVTMTCVSAFDEVLVSSSEPIEHSFPEGEPSGASAQFTTDANGHLVGTVQIHTDLHEDICPKESNTVGAYLVKDYTLTYTNVTVTDNENGGATASIDTVEPSYSSDDVTVAVGGGETFGMSCTIESETSGNCHAD